MIGATSLLTQAPEQFLQPARTRIEIYQGNGTTEPITLGFSGKWDIAIADDLRARQNISTGSVVKTAKALSEVAEARRLTHNFKFGKVTVIDKEDTGSVTGIGLRTVSSGQAHLRMLLKGSPEDLKPSVEFICTSDFLHVSMSEQRRILGEYFDRFPLMSESRMPADLPQVTAPQDTGRAKVVFFEIGGSDVLLGAPLVSVYTYGQNILADKLQGAVEEIRKLQIPFRLANDRERVKALILALQQTTGANIIICSSILNDLELTKEILAGLKRELPNVWIPLGGHGVTALPEVFASEVEGADIFVRGQFEYELPRMVRIIGSSTRDQISPFQAEALGTFAGSVVKLPNQIIINQIDQENRVKEENLDLAKPRKYLRSMHTSWGCPRPSCGHCLAPVKGRMRTIPGAKIYEWLEGMRYAVVPGTLPGAVRIKITDDNPLANMQRWDDLGQKLIGSPLEGFFQFDLMQVATRDLMQMRGVVDRERLRFLKRLGVRQIHLCPDGASDSALRRIGKTGASFRDAMLVNQAGCEEGLKVTNNFIGILPDDKLPDLTLFLLHMALFIESGFTFDTLNPYVGPYLGTRFGNLFIKTQRELMEARFQERTDNPNFIPEFTPWTRETDWFLPIDPSLREQLERHPIYKVKSGSYTLSADPWVYIEEHLMRYLPGVIQPADAWYEWKLVKMFEAIAMGRGDAAKEAIDRAYPHLWTEETRLRLKGFDRIKAEKVI